MYNFDYLFSYFIKDFGRDKLFPFPSHVNLCFHFIGYM